MKHIEFKKLSLCVAVLVMVEINVGTANAQHDYHKRYDRHESVHAFINPFLIYPFYPSIGLRLGVLPRGYFNFYVGAVPYYYYNGIYYNHNHNDYYEVVTPPLGAKVPELPRGAKVTVIDGNKYYVYQGTYYQAYLNQNNERWYNVVGNHGVLNQQNEPPVVQGGTYNPQVPNNTPTTETPSTPVYREPQIGDIVNQLPDNSEVVYLNGQKYFESPTKVFYQEVVYNGKITYKIVGK